jgi:hypothetical protein
MPGTKRPYRHTRGFLDATDDAATIVALWTATPDAEIGLACAPSGLIVFDVDEYHGGDRGDLGADLPDTWEVQTPGGGWHIYFGCDDDTLQFAATLCRGVDVRHRAYVLAPPSHGGRYAWLIGRGPSDLAIAPLPPALAARCADRHRHGCNDRLQRDGSLLSLTIGTRHTRMLKLGGLLRRYGLDVPALTTALLAINQHHVHPSLPERDVRLLAADICRRYRAGAA